MPNHHAGGLQMQISLHVEATLLGIIVTLNTTPSALYSRDYHILFSCGTCWYRSTVRGQKVEPAKAYAVSLEILLVRCLRPFRLRRHGLTSTNSQVSLASASAPTASSLCAPSQALTTSPIIFGTWGPTGALIWPGVFGLLIAYARHFVPYGRQVNVDAYWLAV